MTSLNLLTAPGSKKVAMARSPGLRAYAFRVLALVIFLFTLWLLYSHLGHHGAHQALPHGNQSGKVVVEVYYEVLCPDSRYFILKQLYPTWQRVGSIMDIQYKPYGKASHRASDGGYMFQCQHGPNECQGNMIHTCAMHYIPESTKLTEYIHCMMGDNYDPMQAGRNCASQLEIEWSPIEACASGKEGQKMLAVVGDDTHSLRPRVSFIPTIVLNGSQDNQKMMLKNLLKEVCRKYQGVKPKECIETL
ncbi:gamma-interferon-inducible lysosomal thiol reductase-like isoform X1 [Tigriopus californicus]|uniref:gamma-interferon-inducible lysosomal thiol reductase-like isoform X1 n=1 Tax=Tigriopus californicus TaxID=6832 RepID=UPI0027DA992A|nr:gamma-interferon-inducible lysosomal thiol reductase-like isoform X1 [Tigriopus californicus]